MTPSNKNRSWVVAILSVFLLVTTRTNAFSCPSPQLKSSQRPLLIISSTRTTTSLLMARDTKEGYNDDAFGGIFLGGAVAAQDAVFSAVFLTLSAIAALATQQGKLPANNQVPAAVAGVTLLLTPIVTMVLGGMNNINLPEAGNSSASTFEVVLCVASMVYGFVLSSKE